MKHNVFLRFLFITILSFNTFLGRTQEIEIDSAQLSYMKMLDSIDKQITYMQGVVDIENMVNLTIPQGYKFIVAKDAQMIVADLWGNPKDETIKGMIVSSDYKLSDIQKWAFVISYEESGYVKDENADDIDYTQMLKDIQEDEKEVNKERVGQGYPSIHLLDWANKPYYDKERKILHWAKKLQFGEEITSEDNLTLNYDVRVLGRKGILSMNAVGIMSQLADINKHIPDVLSIAKFKEGYAYSDFNPSVDKVAAYTVGGLIAGKLIAKTGLFVLLLKNIKLIIFGLVALLGTFRKRIAGLFQKKEGTIENESSNYNVAETEISEPSNDKLPSDNEEKAL